MQRRIVYRPIRPDDERAMVDFHRSLSDETVVARYFSVLQVGERIAHDRLLRICGGDALRECVLVAEATDPATGLTSIVGVGRLSKSVGGSEGEVAFLVADGWQRQGIGTALLERLVGIARALGLQRVTAELLGSNSGMRRLAQAGGFRLRAVPGDPSVLHAELELDPSPVPEPVPV